MYIRYFWQGIHHTYGHIRCRYTVLANPTYTQRGRVRAFHIHLHIHIIFTTFAHEALGALKYTHSTCIYARSTSIKYARSTSISTHAAQVSSTHAAQVYARNTCIRTQHMHTHTAHAYAHSTCIRTHHMLTNICLCTGLTRAVYTHRICMVISLPKIPCVHCIYV